MKAAKTEPISIRIASETKELLRNVCMEQGIDLAEYIRRLIDRDLSARDSIPVPEKKFIERILDQKLDQKLTAQAQHITTYFNHNFGDKLDKIYYNMGTEYDKANVKSKELCTYITEKYAGINRPCPENMDDKLIEYRNKYSKININDWEKANKDFKTQIDADVERSDFLYKMMDYAAQQCKRKEVINLFVGCTIQDFRRIFNEISGGIDANYSEIELKIQAKINKEVEGHEAKAMSAWTELKKYAGIDETKANTSEDESQKIARAKEIAKVKTWFQQLKLSKNIPETAEKICETIKPKGIFNKKPNFEKKEAKKQ